MSAATAPATQNCVTTRLVGKAPPKKSWSPTTATWLYLLLLPASKVLHPIQGSADARLALRRPGNNDSKKKLSLQRRNQYHNSYVAVAAYDSDQCNFWDAKNCFVSVGRRSVSPVHYKHCSGTSWITFCGSITLGHVEMPNQISCGTASVFWSSTQWGVNMLHNCSGSDWKHSRCPISNVSAGYYQLWGGAEGGVRAEPVFYAEINVASHWARTPATPACRSCTS